MSAAVTLGAMAAAIALSDVTWAAIVGIGVWLAGWGIISWADRFAPRTQRRGDGDPASPRSGVEATAGAAREATTTLVAAPASSDPTASSPRLTSDVRDALDIAGVLRWLIVETDAEAAGFMQLSPGRAERFVVEPRGLDAPVIAEMAETGRRVLLGPGEPVHASLTVRWLGAGGSKALVLRGSAATTAEEPMRFARFAIELLAAPRDGEAAGGPEERVRAIPGVAWAEMEDASTIRVLPAEGMERVGLGAELDAALQGSGVDPRWLDEPASGPLQARARLLDVTMNVDGTSTAEVHLDWGGRELRGRGHGAATASGRYRASAQAMADALGPLLAGDVRVEGLYTHSHAEESELIVVVVSLDDERLIGAVQARTSDEDASAARAVLDALNRRLSVMAGGSGRI